MTKAIMLLCVLALAACSRDHDKPGTTQTTGASTVDTEQVRLVLLEHNPAAWGAIRSLVITNDNGVVTVRGVVEDENMRQGILDDVRKHPNVKSVRDELRVAKPEKHDVHDKLQEKPAPQPHK
ncbi:MAG: BON domain-containing protein [Labilithrix sp.]|nr:BON domain-containing protein [Labilithrix sp.]